MPIARSSAVRRVPQVLVPLLVAACGGHSADFRPVDETGSCIDWRCSVAKGTTLDIDVVEQEGDIELLASPAEILIERPDVLELVASGQRFAVRARRAGTTAVTVRLDGGLEATHVLRVEPAAVTGIEPMLTRAEAARAAIAAPVLLPGYALRLAAVHTSATGELMLGTPPAAWRLQGADERATVVPVEGSARVHELVAGEPGRITVVSGDAALDVDVAPLEDVAGLLVVDALGRPTDSPIPVPADCRGIGASLLVVPVLADGREVIGSSGPEGLVAEISSPVADDQAPTVHVSSPQGRWLHVHACAPGPAVLTVALAGRVERHSVEFY